MIRLEQKLYRLYIAVYVTRCNNSLFSPIFLRSIERRVSYIYVTIL